MFAAQKGWYMTKGKGKHLIIILVYRISRNCSAFLRGHNEFTVNPYIYFVYINLWAK